jgi:hypothetical protein
MNGYENAVATRLLATHCVCCGRALVDSVSVQMGIGPECREGFNAGIEPDVQKIANEHVYWAAMASQKGEVAKVLEYAELIRKLGLDVLADKVARRFRAAIVKAERSSDIVIEERDGGYRVVTPFRRGAKDEFIDAWRNIPGRRWRDGANWVPAASKAALWEVLRAFFPGKYGKGPKGVFRIPAAAHEAKQGELALVG